MLTTVILAPGACWGGSDGTDLAPKPRASRANRANRMCSRGYHIFQFFHRCERPPPADPPGRRPWTLAPMKKLDVRSIYGQK